MNFDHYWSITESEGDPSRKLRTVSRWRCPSCGKSVLIDSWASEEGYRHPVARRSIEEIAEREILAKVDAGCPCGAGVPENGEGTG